MEHFSEYCFQTLAKERPFDWPGQLEKSPVTDADIQAVEAAWGYRFPEEFREFLMSYILPSPTWVYGKFYGESFDDWPGGGTTYSPELKRYLQWDEIPDDQEICVLEFNLSGLEEMADIRGHSLQENIERLSWTGTAPSGYILLGEFTGNYVFLECETGRVVCVDHDCYTMSHQPEVENIREYQSLLFKNFYDLLKCLFLGIVCDGATSELMPVE